MKTQFLLTTFLTIFTHLPTYKSCTNQVIETHLGTKSAYRYVSDETPKPSEENQCAKKIWMFIRHGTRYPSVKDITLMEENVTRIRDDIIRANRLDESDMLLFEKWFPRVDKYEAKRLTTEGESEMIGLAERMLARFPTVLKPVYNNASYVFKYTKSQRTKESAKFFTIGLFGKGVSGDVYFPMALKPDPILRFYKLCEKWLKKIKMSLKTYSERDEFQRTKEMKNALRNVSNKLGINTLTTGDLRSMYTTCAFESSWTKRKKSPWCVPFDEETIKVMEYAEDLRYYWVDGYGYNLTCRQACPAFQDMFNFMKNTDPYPNAVFYFTHSGALLKLLCHLGIYKDNSPLTANTFKSNQGRKWRVSKIDPFANNLAFILYECNGMKSLQLLHNENVVQFPACPRSDLCDINVVEKYYRESLNCGFDEMCEYSGS